MIEIFSYILGFLTLIMVITAIHEAGHFYVARFFNVKILDFSIGMGRSIKNYIGKDLNCDGSKIKLIKPVWLNN